MNKLFKRILTESKQKELFRRILIESEEEKKINPFKHKQGTQAYNDNSQYIDDDNNEPDNIVDINIENQQNSQHPLKPSDYSFVDYLDKYMKIYRDKNN
jgi:hypothetical protein